jgi:hypothetical protein
MAAKHSKKRTKKAASKKAARKPPKKAPARKPKNAKKPAPKPKARASKAKKATSPHPKLPILLKKLRPGRHAAGTLIVTEPGALHDEMSRWLEGNTDGRVALGRTAFGDIVVFRDLRERAAAQGLRGADSACDVALIDLNLKKMIVLGSSVEEFVRNLDEKKFQNTYLRRKLFDRVKSLLGEPTDDEAYAFVPALALGGSEDETQVERRNWAVYQDILFQL